MRQAGVLAAAGIVALEQMVDRLAEDHANAQALAAGLAEVSWLFAEPVPVRTNILYITVRHSSLSAEQIAAALAQKGVLMLALGQNRVRAVTNYHITSADIQAALDAVHSIRL
jgi:threonine aldolase